LDEKTRDRELRSLKAISDNYPKYILTMDQTIFKDYGGIKIKNLIDFLLE
jgi:predicted AAA+ superfamily ATPase